VVSANTGTFVNGVGGSTVAANTTYYVYVFNNAGTLALDFCSTGHATSTTAGNVGTEIKSGDNTRTLVGMTYTNGVATQFQINLGGTSTTAGAISTITWFNRLQHSVMNGNSGNVSTAAAPWVNLSNSFGSFLCWGGPDNAVSAVASCESTNNTANSPAYLITALDSSPNGIYGVMSCSTAGLAYTATSQTAWYPAEGRHVFTVMGGSGGGGDTATFFAGATGVTITYMG
jgi:hypothetical protein